MTTPQSAWVQSPAKYVHLHNDDHSKQRTAQLGSLHPPIPTTSLSQVPSQVGPSQKKLSISYLPTISPATLAHQLQIITTSIPPLLPPQQQELEQQQQQQQQKSPTETTTPTREAPNLPCQPSGPPPKQDSTVQYRPSIIHSTTPYLRYRADRTPTLGIWMMYRLYRHLRMMSGDRLCIVEIPNSKSWLL